MKAESILYWMMSVVFSLTCLSCSEKAPSEYVLQPTDSKLVFELDTESTNRIGTYFIYEEKGKEYFVMQNANANKLVFYDLKTGKKEFETRFAREGNNGIGELDGFFIHNLDSIYVLGWRRMYLNLTNREGRVLERYSYEFDSSGEPLEPVSLYAHQPAERIGRKLYLYPEPNRLVEKDPVTFTFDMDTKEIRRLPFYYPDYPGSETKVKQYGLENMFSRCFDGERFIYAFDFDEEVYVANIAHDSIRRVPVGSRYIDKFVFPSETQAQLSDFLEDAWYGSLWYDKYRDVYYRVVNPPTSVEDATIGLIELIQYGGKNFSIVILDKDLKKIGETMFPDYTYNSRVLIILEDGLYISESHPMNPDFSDDYLSFRKFELVKEQPKE